eukprot:3594893-Prorocentrum_lima.AAC.1
MGGRRASQQEGQMEVPLGEAARCPSHPGRGRGACCPAGQQHPPCLEPVAGEQPTPCGIYPVGG